MLLHLPRFVRDHSELQALLERANLLPCSHCGAYGTLIGHGMLRGYEERGSELAIRGRRLFCSNRGRKRGCGRTTSVLLAAFIKRFSVTVATIFSLFLGRCRRDSVAGAAGARWPLSARSAYRLAARLERSSLDWRALLSASHPAPSSASTQPMAQLLEHLIARFGRHRPLEALQLETGRSLL